MHSTTTTKMFSTFALLLLSFLYLDTVTSIRDVHVKIPHAIRRGEKAILKCLYELDDDDILYSVKWYRGRREFYSFTPKETPAMKVYQLPGIKVDRSMSNESQLVLDTVNLATTGKYSCEVSADAPSFHTLIGAGELEVVEVLGKDPIITGIRPRYRVGDIVRGNCTLRHSKPAANLTWTINGYETNPSHIRHHKPIKDVREMETAISGIHFVVTPQHFIYGKLKIRCTAHIHDVYWKSTEKSVEEERHRHGSGNNINLVNTFSEDYFDLEDGNLIDRSDTYMTHIKGDVSSLNAGVTGIHHAKVTLLPCLITLSLVLHVVQQILQLCRQLLLQITIAIAKGVTRKSRVAKKKILKRIEMKTKKENIKEKENEMQVKKFEIEMEQKKCCLIGVGCCCCCSCKSDTKGQTVSGNISVANLKMKIKIAATTATTTMNTVTTKEVKVREKTSLSDEKNAIENAVKNGKNFSFIRRKSERQLLQGQLLEATKMNKKSQQQQQQQLAIEIREKFENIKRIKKIEKKLLAKIMKENCSVSRICRIKVDKKKDAKIQT